MSYFAEQILEYASFSLVERVVNTTLGGPVVAPGPTHIPLVSKAIYVGAQLVAGTMGTASAEVITVIGIDATGFTAVFAKVHAASDPLRGATVASGHPDAPLFTQQELLAYLASAQNDFLMRTRCIYAVVTSQFQADTMFYAQPDDAIRMERIAAPNKNAVLTSLLNTSQEELDILDSAWMLDKGLPRQWFQDEINTGRYGVTPQPTVGGTNELWYSQRGPSTLTLTDALLVPDCAAHYLKYRVLGRCFAKDGEQRNPILAEYCYRRYKFGLMLISKFMLGMQVGLQQGVPAAIAFNPMAVPDAQNPASMPPPEDSNA